MSDSKLMLPPSLVSASYVHWNGNTDSLVHEYCLVFIFFPLLSTILLDLTPIATDLIVTIFEIQFTKHMYSGFNCCFQIYQTIKQLNIYLCDA